MSEQHTQEPWFITGMGRKLVGGAGAYDWTVCGNKHECFATNDDGEDMPGGMVQTVVAHFAGVKGSEEAARVNAARACACVNACCGIPTAALKAGAIQVLIHTAKNALNNLDDVPGRERQWSCAQLEAALDRLKETP